MSVDRHALRQLSVAAATHDPRADVHSAKPEDARSGGNNIPSVWMLMQLSCSALNLPVCCESRACSSRFDGLFRRLTGNCPSLPRNGREMPRSCPGAAAQLTCGPVICVDCTVFPCSRAFKDIRTVPEAAETVGANRRSMQARATRRSTRRGQMCV